MNFKFIGIGLVVLALIASHYWMYKTGRKTVQDELLLQKPHIDTLIVRDTIPIPVQHLEADVIQPKPKPKPIPTVGISLTDRLRDTITTLRDSVQGLLADVSTSLRDSLGGIHGIVYRPVLRRFFEDFKPAPLHVETKYITIERYVERDRPWWELPLAITGTAIITLAADKVFSH